MQNIYLRRNPLNTDRKWIKYKRNPKKQKGAYDKDDSSRQICCNLYGEAILKEREILPGFLTAGHNLNNVTYSKDTVLIADTESKLQEPVT